MTVSAATLGVALSAPIFGALTERLPRKRVIVASLIGISVPTLLTATSTSLAQLIFWRFLQGVTIPGVVAVLVTYIGEEWPPHRVALVMSYYVSGTALGGFIGRVSSGILADHFNWRVSFLFIGSASLAGAAAVAAWLPHGRRRPVAPPVKQAEPTFIYQVQACSQPTTPRHIRRRLQCSVFPGRVSTWITFHLSAAPFLLSTTALSSLFFVYLVGLVVTPAAGYIITRVGLRVGIAGAISAHRRCAAHTRPIALDCDSWSDHAFERRVHRADSLAEPSPRGSPARRPRHRSRSLHHLLLPRWNRRRSRPGRFLGLRKMARVRSLYRSHAASRAHHRVERLANPAAYRCNKSIGCVKSVTRIYLASEGCCFCSATYISHAIRR